MRNIKTNIKNYFFFFFIFFIPLFLIRCNMLFYRKNQPQPYLSFYKDNIFGEVILEWEEKIEHPLSGTTKKRNYKTKVSILEIHYSSNEVKNVSRKFSKEFNFWVLPEFFYILNLEPIEYVFLYGELPEDYGIKFKFGYYNENSKENNNITSLENIQYFLPSPDKKTIYTLQSNNNIVIYKIENQKLIPYKRKELEFKILEPGMISWNPKNFNILYIYQNNNVFIYDIEKNNISQTYQFPECIIPPTSIGGSFDIEGNQFIYDIENKKYKIINLKNFTSFYNKKFIDNIKDVHYSCFD